MEDYPSMTVNIWRDTWDAARKELDSVLKAAPSCLEPIGSVKSTEKFKFYRHPTLKQVCGETLDKTWKCSMCIGIGCPCLPEFFSVRCGKCARQQLHTARVAVVTGPSLMTMGGENTTDLPGSSTSCLKFPEEGSLINVNSTTIGTDTPAGLTSENDDDDMCQTDRDGTIGDHHGSAHIAPPIAQDTESNVESVIVGAQVVDSFKEAGDAEKGKEKRAADGSQNNEPLKQLVDYSDSESPEFLGEFDCAGVIHRYTSLL